MSAPPPTPPDSLYSSGADEAADVAARLAEDAAGLPARTTRDDTTLSCAACFARVAPRAQPHAHGRGLFRTVYLVDGAVRVQGSVEVRERGPVAGNKRGRGEAESGAAVGATTEVPALVCTACGAELGAVHDDGDGVPVYTLWDVLPGE